MKQRLDRIYHPWWLWEDFKSGFYNTDCVNKKKTNTEKVILFFNDKDETELYMRLVTEKWKFSCEQNLTNYNMNRVAYIGQAACCYHMSIPSYTTMYAWKFLETKIQDRSNKIAQSIINKWEQERRYNNILNHGSQKDMKKGYQMSLQLN